MPETERTDRGWHAATRWMEHCARRLMRGASGAWIQQLARVGYATRGAVFALIGLLAVQVALGWGGELAGQRRAIWLVGRSAVLGSILLWLTTVGLGGYVLWRFVQAVLHPMHEERSLVRQGAYIGSGLFYALLTLTTLQLALGGASQAAPGDAARRAWTAWALAMPLGPWIVGLVGVVLAGAGAHALYRAYCATFMQLYGARLKRLAGKRQAAMRLVGRAGLAALGGTLLIIGGLVVEAAWWDAPESVVGIGGALGRLLDGPYGFWILGAVGVGFVAYGFHCFALARYRQLRASGFY
jgi:hypothetical protein